VDHEDTIWQPSANHLQFATILLKKHALIVTDVWNFGAAASKQWRLAVAKLKIVARVLSRRTKEM